MKEKSLSEELPTEVNITHYRGVIFVGLALIYTYLWWNQIDSNLPASIPEVILIGITAGLINAFVYIATIFKKESKSLPVVTLIFDLSLVAYANTIAFYNQLEVLIILIVLRLMIAPPRIRKIAFVATMLTLCIMLGYRVWRDQGFTWDFLGTGWIYIALMMMAAIEGYRLGNNHQRIALEKALESKSNELESIREKLEGYKELDPLTGVYNRRYFNVFSDEAFRQNRPLSIIFASIKDLRQINEEKGAQVGDMILQEVAEVLSLHIRNEDTLCRYSGNIFAIIALRDGRDELEIMQERLASLVRRTRIEGHEDLTVEIITVAASKAGHKNVSELIQEVDEKLKNKQKKTSEERHGRCDPADER